MWALNEEVKEELKNARFKKIHERAIKIIELAEKKMERRGIANDNRPLTSPKSKLFTRVI